MEAGCTGEVLVDSQVESISSDKNLLLSDERSSRELKKSELRPPHSAECELSCPTDLSALFGKLPSVEQSVVTIDVVPESTHKGSESILFESDLDSLAHVEQPSLNPESKRMMSENPEIWYAESNVEITDAIADNKPYSEVSHGNSPCNSYDKHVTSPTADNNNRPPSPETSTFFSSDHGNGSNEKRILFLEMELAKAQSIIDSQERKHLSENGNNSSLLVELQIELQGKLENEEKKRLEAEERARVAEKLLEEMEVINQKQAQEINQLAAATGKLQNLMNARKEAENKALQATDRVHELERAVTRQKFEIEEYEKMTVKLREKLVAIEKEKIVLRDKYIKQEQLQMSATTRLAIAKKTEADQACLAGKYEDLMISALAEKDQAKVELQETRRSLVALETELDSVKRSLAFHLDKSSLQIQDERKLNDERKQKMKHFIESKTEEIRQAKEYNESLQLELSQTNKSLVDLNTRLNQLHNQWVQSQTRNRELQRDLNRIKKDSENLHKVGDTLEMKLSRSANETEEHKTKRLAAKQELMTVLRALETERKITSFLKESLKFKLTPKVLNQQESLNGGLVEFEHQLQKLAIRLGKSSTASAGDSSNPSSLCKPFQFSANGDHQPDSDSTFLVAKLEHELKCVSDIIQRLIINITALRDTIDESGERTCLTVFSELLTSGGLIRAAVATRDESQSSVPSSRLGLGRHRYGQVPADNDN